MHYWAKWAFGIFYEKVWCEPIHLKCGTTTMRAIEYIYPKHFVTLSYDAYIYTMSNQQDILFWDFYFRALRSLVVLSFPQPLSFSSVFPSL
jgi:hypothetical protein